MSFLFFPVALTLWAVLYTQESPDSWEVAGTCLAYGFFGGMFFFLILAFFLPR